MSSAMDESKIKYSDVEAAERCVGDVFRASAGQDPKNRFLPYVSLLRLPDFECPGFQEPSLSADKTDGRSPEGAQSTSAGIDKFLQLYGTMLSPTYSAVSYWSPLDRRRRTVYHCKRIPDIDRTRRFAFAFAFYAMTFAGEKRDPPLLSITHFTATHTPEGRGLTTCFNDECQPDEGDLWLKIPAVLRQGLLQETGIEELISDLLINRFEQAELSRALRAVLVNDTANPWEQYDREGFAVRAIRVFCERVVGLSGDLQQVLESATSFMNLFFRPDPQGVLLKRPLDPVQVCFMLATQLMWRTACEADFMYSFPTSLNTSLATPNTCCILTLGTMRPMTSMELLVAASISRSLFVHPLLIDYSVMAAEAEENRRNNIFRRLIGHNLPKLLIWPSASELMTLEEYVAADAPASAKVEATTAIQNMRTLFNHYEDFLLAVMGSRSLKENFQRSIQRFDLMSLAQGKGEVIFRLAVDRLLDPLLRSEIRLEIDCPDPCPVDGHEAFIEEIMFNLLSNAVDAIDPRSARGSPERAVIRLSVDPIAAISPESSEEVRISVQDRGVGFSTEYLNRARKMFIELETATAESLWRTLDSMMAAVANEAREERLGIGLIFCAAYLRSLEWQSPIRKRGRLEIQSDGSSGATVSITLPCSLVPPGTQKRHVVFSGSSIQRPLARPSDAESVLICTQTSAVRSALTAKLNLTSTTVAEALTDSAWAFGGSPLPPGLEAEVAAATIIILDLESHPTDKAQIRELSALSRSALYAALEDATKIPQSLQLLKYFDLQRNHNLQASRLVICILENPNTMMTDAILSLGADWVWSSRDDFSDLAGVLRGIRSFRPLNSGAGVQKPTVFVVENSRVVCLAIRKRFSTVADVEFAGADKPGFRFEISPEEAISRFRECRRQGPIRLVILDLALEDWGESEARQHFATWDTAKSSISAAMQDPNRCVEILKILPGLAVARQLRQEDPRVPIVIFSSYVGHEPLHNFISLLVGERPSERLRIIAKSDQSLSTLRGELQSMLAVSSDANAAALSEGRS